MTRRGRTNQSVERRLVALESDAREDTPAKVRGVSVPWVSYDTDADSTTAEFVVVDGSAGE